MKLAAIVESPPLDIPIYHRQQAAEKSIKQPATSAGHDFGGGALR